MLEIRTSTPLRTVPADYAPEGSAQWFTLADGPDAGRTLFYFDHVTGASAPEQTVVLVHGNPECSYTYRHVWQALMDSGRPLRIIAMATSASASPTRPRSRWWTCTTRRTSASSCATSTCATSRW